MIDWAEEFGDTSFILIEAEAQGWLTSDKHNQEHNALTEEEIIVSIVYGGPGGHPRECSLVTHQTFPHTPSSVPSWPIERSLIPHRTFTRDP